MRAERRDRGVPFTTRDGRDGLVRAARDGDARAALAITAEAMRERPRSLAVVEGELWSVREWRRNRVESGSGATFVAEVDGAVVGVLSVHRGARPSVSHVAEFGITVSRSARSLGVGRALIEAAERWALEREVTRMTLRVFETNPRAHALYASLGYRDEGVEHQGVRFPEGPVDVIRMYKFLGEPRAHYDERRSRMEG